MMNFIYFKTKLGRWWSFKN